MGHRVGASPLHFAVIQPEVAGPGEAAERGSLEEGGEQGQQQKNLICTVRPFESLLLQYTLTKIESHFISIQQQQKNSFLDCYTANGFQRSLFTVTVAKREGALGLGAGTGGSETMRAREQGGEVAAKELGGWERAQETREAGLRTSRPPPTLTHPTCTPQGRVRAGEGQSPRSHLPGRGRLPLSHLTPAPVPSPPCLWPALQGWCH